MLGTFTLLPGTAMSTRLILSELLDYPSSQVSGSGVHLRKPANLGMPGPLMPLIINLIRLCTVPQAIKATLPRCGVLQTFATKKVRR